jgi:hypothetical protein
MRTLLIVFFLICSHFARSQNKILFGSDDNKLLKAVVSDAIYILRQDYYLIDSTVKRGKKYGLNNKEYFGRCYFVAIAVNNQFYVDSAIMTPWDLDSNYTKYSSSKKYKPELSELAFRNIKEKKFSLIDKSILKDSPSRSYPLLIMPSHDSLNSIELLNFSDSLLDSTAWFYVADLNYNIEKDEDSFIFETMKGRYSSQNDSFICNKFYYGNNTIGGFIFSTVPQFGFVKYCLSGIVKKNNGKFQFISLISKKVDNGSQGTKAIISKPVFTKPVLSEIEDKSTINPRPAKKRKKNNK